MTGPTPELIAARIQAIEAEVRDLRQHLAQQPGSITSYELECDIAALETEKEQLLRAGRLCRSG